MKSSSYCARRVFTLALPSYSTAQEIRIKTRTQRRLVPIVVCEIHSLLVSGHGTYQPGLGSGLR